VSAPTILAQFRALPARDQMRLLAEMHREFTWSYAHADLERGVYAIAEELAQEEGWTGDELADRYLAPSRAASFDGELIDPATAQELRGLGRLAA